MRKVSFSKTRISIKSSQIIRELFLFEKGNIFEKFVANSWELYVYLFEHELQ